MADHKPLPVKGYTLQPDKRVQTVNAAKELEERVLRHLDLLMAHPGYDHAMVTLARRRIQEGFMWANRAVFQPGRVALPEDPTEPAP